MDAVNEQNAASRKAEVSTQVLFDIHFSGFLKVCAGFGRASSTAAKLVTDMTVVTYRTALLKPSDSMRKRSITGRVSPANGW